MSFSPSTIFLAAFMAAPVAAQEVCTSHNNVFTVKVNLFAGELGYYEFEECDGPNPTIGMEIGETYTFVQGDPSNFYHPLGFAYFPDGAHDDVEELEPGISGSSLLTGSTQGSQGEDCTATLTCPAPMYFKDGVYLGQFNNLNTSNVIGAEDFGLDSYEPEFFYPITEWVGAEYTVQLNYNDESYTKDLFYFCHIHHHMSGRIKLLSGGEPVQIENDPPIEYEYDIPGATLDQQCGTYGLDAFVLPNELCPSSFVCDAENSDLQDFAKCIDAMNCHMLHGMTTGIASNSDVALFIHQMIPHHQNAVNMAKLLLKSANVVCDDLTEETPACIMNAILREIINNQNYQIQLMRGVLDSEGYLPEDNCEVLLSTVSNLDSGAVSDSTDGEGGGNGEILVNGDTAPNEEPSAGTTRFAWWVLSSAASLMLVFAL